MKRILFFLLVMIAVLSMSRPAMAILYDRGSFSYDDGAGNTGIVNLIYDKDFDITWVGDGNFAQTTCFDVDGKMTWFEADAWARGLTIGGSTDWRLPTSLNQDGSGPVGAFHATGSEMGHLYSGELGGAYSLISASSDPDLGLFPNLKDYRYWSGTETLSGVTTLAWNFDFSKDLQSANHHQSGFFYALAVHSGDVGAAPVPEPATVALLGIGLVGMAVAEVRRRRKKEMQLIIAK